MTSAGHETDGRTAEDGCPAAGSPCTRQRSNNRMERTGLRPAAHAERYQIDNSEDRHVLWQICKKNVERNSQ